MYRRQKDKEITEQIEEGSGRIEEMWCVRQDKLFRSSWEFNLRTYKTNAKERLSKFKFEQLKEMNGQMVFSNRQRSIRQTGKMNTFLLQVL